MVYLSSLISLSTLNRVALWNSMNYGVLFPKNFSRKIIQHFKMSRLTYGDLGNQYF